MHKNYSSYIQFLANEYNVLYLTKENQKLYDAIAPYFNSANKIDLNEDILAKISSLLSKNNINIVLIDAKNEKTLANRFFEQIKAYDSEILTMLIFDPKHFEILSQTISMTDAIVYHPVTEELFYKKLFTLLSVPYAIKSIGRRDIMLKQSTITEDSTDKFFDTYEGSSLFIADELTDMVAQLNYGELSYELLNQIAEKLDEVADIFSKTENTSAVTPTYKELASFLRNIQLEELQAKNLRAFDYLSEIISDVSVYLLDMFVDRIFRDVHIFKDSLQNNVDFMKVKLYGNEDEENGELDFF